MSWRSTYRGNRGMPCLSIICRSCTGVAHFAARARCWLRSLIRKSDRRDSDKLAGIDRSYFVQTANEFRAHASTAYRRRSCGQSTVVCRCNALSVASVIIASAGWIFDQYESQIFVLTKDRIFSDVFHHRAPR